MANDLKSRKDANPGQQHEDDLFKHFEDQYHNPTGSAHAENANIDRANSSLRDDLTNAENSAAAGASTSGAQNQSVANRESNPPSYYSKPRMGDAKATAAKAVKDAKARSTAYRASGGRRRGLLIGLGAGGGLLSIIAGISSLLPFKLPGIMDTLVNDAGKRVEKVIERRAERVVLTYILRGSSAAVKNGHVIVTGNPIGDLFANMRTSKFERNLFENHALSIEPSPDGEGVRLKHHGNYIRDDYGNGTYKNLNDLFKIIDSGKSLTKADLRAIVRSEIPAWRFWKRAKFVKWLLLKYNIPRLGTREQNDGEKDEDYEKAVKKEHIQQVETANMRNLSDFVDCAADSGDCVDKTDEGGKLAEETEKLVAETAEELAEEGAKRTSSTIIKMIISKLTSKAAISAIPYVGAIDMGARMMHGIGEVIDDDLLQKKHAEYIKRSSAVLATTYAGYADQTKAGDNKPEIVGMFSSNFDNWEASASYGLIQSGALGTAVAGETLDGMERVNESIESNAFIDVVKTLFGTVGWIGRAPLEAWYYTVSQVFDLVDNVIGGAVGWIIEHTPARALMAQLGSVMADIFTGLLKFVGMFVDPLVVGAKLGLFVHQGFLATFNDKANEDGMRMLSPAQAVGVDRQIRQDRLADMQNMSLYERLLDLNRSDSLATALVTTMPSKAAQDPIAALTTASASLVASAPSNLARATSGTAMAATAATMPSEALFGINAYGALESDMAADLDPSVSSPNATCPENNPNSFNHCKVDTGVVTTMNCVFVKCPDMNQSEAYLQDNPLFAFDAQGPLYGPDAVTPTPRNGAIALDWTKAGGLLAAIIPIGALEVSRRRLA